MGSFTTLTSDLAEQIAAKFTATENAALQQPTPEPVVPAVSQPTSEPVVPPASVDAQDGKSATELEDDFEFDPDEKKADATKEPDKEAVQSDAPAAPEDKLDPDKDIVGAMLATSRGKRIYADYKELTEVAKPIEEGGIGYKPSAQEIREFHQSHQVRSQMLSAFEAGDPQSAAEWVQGWFGKWEDGANNVGAETVLETLPYTLAEIQPELFNKHIATPVAYGLAEHFAQMAASSQDPTLAAQAKFVADFLVWDRGGKVPQSPGQALQQGQDPEKQAMIEENRRLRQQLGQQHSQSVQGQMQQIQSNLDSAKENALVSDINRAAQKIEETAKQQTGGPELIDALKFKFKYDVQQGLEKNRANLELLRMKERNAIRTGNRDAVQQIVREYRRLYEIPFMEARTKFINAAGMRLKSSNEATILKLQQAAQKQGASQGMASPTGNLNGSGIQRNEDEPYEDFLKRKMVASGWTQ